MECYSITLHKTSVQFLYLKKGAKHQPQKSEWKYLFFLLKSTSMAHAPHTVHELTFKPPTEDMVAGTRANSPSRSPQFSYKRLVPSGASVDMCTFTRITEPR